MREGITFLVTASLLASSSALAQNPSADPPGENVDTIELAAAASAKIVRSRAVAQPPVLDGDVLGDPAWADAEPVSGFPANAGIYLINQLDRRRRCQD